jgi:hypothetical protein
MELKATQALKGAKGDTCSGDKLKVTKRSKRVLMELKAKQALKVTQELKALKVK